MTDPYVNNLPKGATWSEGPALDTETRGDLDSMEIAHITSPSLKDASKNFKLPSVEQMRREVETGEFSPESLAIARSIQAEALGVDLKRIDDEAKLEDPLADVDDWWSTQEHFGAPLSEAELANETLMRNYSDLTDHERDLLKSRQAQRRARSQQWREEASKPAAPLPSAAHFKKTATEAKKTTKAFKKISKAIPQKPAPGAKLQHRPFLILSAIRDEL